MFPAPRHNQIKHFFETFKISGVIWNPVRELFFLNFFVEKLYEIQYNI